MNLALQRLYYLGAVAAMLLGWGHVDLSNLTSLESARGMTAIAVALVVILDATSWIWVKTRDSLATTLAWIDVTGVVASLGAALSAPILPSPLPTISLLALYTACCALYWRQLPAGDPDLLRRVADAWCLDEDGHAEARKYYLTFTAGSLLLVGILLLALVAPDKHAEAWRLLLVGSTLYTTVYLWTGPNLKVLTRKWRGQHQTRADLTSTAKPLPSCFISYDHTDEEFVHQVRTDFEKRSVKFWIDKKDRDHTRTWEEQIPQAINKHDAFLLVVSPSSINNYSVFDELHHLMTTKRADHSVRAELQPLAKLKARYVNVFSRGATDYSQYLMNRPSADFEDWKTSVADRDTPSDNRRGMRDAVSNTGWKFKTGMERLYADLERVEEMRRAISSSNVPGEAKPAP